MGYDMERWREELSQTSWDKRLEKLPMKLEDITSLDIWELTVPSSIEYPYRSSRHL